MEYKEQKRCCSICDAKKICHVCGKQTLYACSDCQINFNATVYVCQSSKCRDAHEMRCYGSRFPAHPQSAEEFLIDKKSI